MMTLQIAAVLGGFALLMAGADRFVAGAAGLARALGVSPLVIGLTIVGFGTSAPEMLVSAMAAWQGNPGLAVGNALGSNITNIGLVLGLTALVAPLAVNSETLRREFPILLAIMAGALLLFLDGEMTRWNGMVLLAGMGAVVYWMVSLGLRDARDDPMTKEYEQEIPGAMSVPRALAWLALGLTVLLLSSRLLVWGAVGVAQALGVSDLIIGLTVVAIGTSLPELAASVVGALKGEHDIAIGNVLGSNMFNLLAVMGLAGAIAPHALEPEMLSRDYAVMVGFTLALFAMAFGFRRQGRINRLEGALLLGAYAVYIVYLFRP